MCPCATCARASRTRSTGAATRGACRRDYRNGGRVYAVTTRDVLVLAGALLPRLSDEELIVVRAMLEPQGTAASRADYFASRAVGTLLHRTRQRWLGDLLDDRRLMSYFQPIVGAADPHEIYGYECLMRGRRPDGEVGLIYPDELLAAAHDADLLPPLDLAARLAAIQGAASHGIREAIFINFSPAAIYDPAFCLRSTIAAVTAAGLSPAQIVFEVTESERLPSNPGHLIGILDYYRAAGFRVALDDVGSGYSSLVMLGDVRPDFLKLDKGLTNGVMGDPFRAVIAEKLIEAALGTGMAIVAEGIETAKAAQWFQDRGVQYLQGYYFARPAAVPPRVLMETPGSAPS